MRKQSRTNKKRKNRGAVRTYISSLWLFFLLEFVLLLDFKRCPKPEGCPTLCLVEQGVYNVYLPFSLILFVFSVLLALIFLGETKGSTNPSYRIKSIRNENYEYLTFLITVIFPLFAFQAPIIQHVVAVVILLIVMGFILIKLDLYWANPTLAIFGFHLYRAEILNRESPNGILLITKNKLTEESAIKWREIGENVWFVSEVKSDGEE